MRFLDMFKKKHTQNNKEAEAPDTKQILSIDTQNALVVFLKNKISKRMPLEDIVCIFEEMCHIPIKDDMILFETGTFSFTGRSLFSFSLVRQFPNGQDEYHQIHLDVRYKPNEANKRFSETTWNENVDEDIFNHIRRTEAFAYAKEDTYIEISIYMDET